MDTSLGNSFLSLQWTWAKIEKLLMTEMNPQEVIFRLTLFSKGSH